MADVVVSERPANRRVIAILLLVGFAVTAIGASAATSLQVWDLDVAERIAKLAEGSRVAWIWGNALLAIGIAVAASGMFALASVLANALAKAGGAFWLIAGTVSAIAFVLQGVGGAESANLWGQTGEIPGGFLVIHAVQESLLTLFGALGSLGTVAIGIASTRTPWMAKVWGAGIAGAGIAGLVLLGLNIPIIALTGAVVAAVGLLVPVKHHSEERPVAL